jgi:serine/threonine protein kinase
LGDFGVSKRITEDKMDVSKVGTPAYQSPEQVSALFSFLASIVTYFSEFYLFFFF